MPHIRPALGLTVLLAVACASSLASAQEEDTFDRTPVDCISVTSIDRTDVIDDQTILFFMRGKKIYRNYLPRKCPGLQRQDRFAYETKSNRLCDIDTVTVLEQWGTRLNAGFTCPLGAFHPISPEEVEELAALAEGGASTVDVESVELPDEESDETPASGAAEAEPLPDD
jgi:Family of unknown function (DUF6491)